MANPIAFLLGAGASLPFGIPMMAGFYAEFREYLARRHPHCFALLERLECSGHHATRDLETLLSDLNAVADVERGIALLGGTLVAYKQDVELAQELRGYLDAFIVDTCERFDRAAAAREFEPILKLREVAPVWIFTTNYDRIVEHACDRAGVTWTDGFESSAAYAVADWTGSFDAEVRIVKLHGSVNWYIDDPDGSLHRLDRGYSLPAYDFQLVRRDQRLRPLMIIPTLEKEALGTPYIELSIRFTDALQETHLLIIAGSSLRDRHIRDYIRARMHTLQVIIVNPEAATSRRLLGSEGRVHAVNAGFSEFLAVGGSKLVDLARTLNGLSMADESNRSVVESFMGSISEDTLDETAIRKESELHRWWAASRAVVTAERVQAVRQLAFHAHPAVMRRLEVLLREDPEAHVRVACVSALMQARGTSAIPVLGKALLEEASTPVQLEIALAMLQFADEARDDLARALARADLSSVARAVIADRFAQDSPSQ